MKWMLSLLISVFILNQEKLSADTYSFSEDIVGDAFNNSLGAEEESKDFFNIPTEFRHYTSKSSSDNQLPHKSKKKNKKGVKPVYSCLPVDCVVFSVRSDRDEIFSKKDSEISFCFSGNGKRGPPFLLV